MRKLVEKQGIGDVEEIHGPFPIAGTRVWDVWVHDGNEYDVTFVTLDKDKPVFLSGVPALCMHMDTRYGLAKVERGILGVGAAAFLVSVLAVVYVATVTPEKSSYGLWLLGGVIASGAAVFLRGWRAIAMPAAQQDSN